VARAHGRCIDGAFDVHGLDRAPVLLTASLPPDWRSWRLYQRMR
jgi:hypothetical protein